MIKQVSNEIFRQKMENESTSYLERILEIHDTQEWTKEQFEVIAGILQSREDSPPGSTTRQPPQEEAESVPLTPQQQEKETQRAFRRVVIGIIILVTLYPTAAGLMAYQNAQTSCQARSSNGAVALAVITEMKQTFGETDQNLVTFNFPAQYKGELTTISKRVDISYRLYNSLQVGQQVNVIYDQTYPYNAVLEAEDGCSGSTILMIICILPVVFTGFLVFMFRNFLFPSKKTGTPG